MIITVCPPLVHPSVGDMALIIGDTAPGYMPANIIHQLKMNKKLIFADVFVEFLTTVIKFKLELVIGSRVIIKTRMIMIRL